MRETIPAKILTRFPFLRRYMSVSFLSVIAMCAILACVLNFDLFTHPDRSITFDGRVHITSISMYHDLLAAHQFPIVWVDNWGNYGYPLGLVSHQVTSYLGGLLQFFVGSPVASYNTLFWLATFFSGVLMYVWLRGHTHVPAAMLGTVLFLFAPYHIQNIYVRGALPEYVSTVFLLLALIGVQRVVMESKFYGYVCITLGIAFLVLSHPMMLVTGALLLTPYTLILCFQKKRDIKTLFFIGGSAFL